jgi:hypothetical protein
VRGGGVVILVLTELDELNGHESSLIDFTIMEEEAESTIEFIHRVAYQEFISRNIESMWGWELRTKHMFEHNALYTVGDVMGCSLRKVNRLMGCGFITRKEIYDVFCLYHFKLKYWSPDLHWNKANYKF